MQTCPNCGRESPDEFDFCPACGQPLTRPKPGREVRKTVTVVFCDVTGSTALGERLVGSAQMAVRSKSGSIRTWRSSARGAGPSAYKRSWSGRSRLSAAAEDTWLEATPSDAPCVWRACPYTFHEHCRTRAS
jgi:hypothetical protein